jgi:hypothetical protein
MKKVTEIGIKTAGSNQSLSMASAASGLAAIINFGHNAGDARKALHSDLVVAGAGTEVLAMFSEHGTNATLPGGAYSLPPYRYALDVGRHALDEVHRASGCTELLNDLAIKLAAEGGIPTVNTHGGEVLDDDVAISLPGLLSTPLPTRDEWAFFQRIRDEATIIAMDPDRLKALKRDGLRRLLLLLLLASGLPLKNLTRYRQYYSFGSFVFVGGLPAYFVALMRQTDLGLGLLPIKIAHPDSVARVLAAMSSPCGVTSDGVIFRDFDWDAEVRRRSVVRMLSRRCQSQLPLDADRMLDSSATLVSLLNIGGFLTTSLRDSLWIPSNYYHIVDLLSAKGVARTAQRGIDGEPWRDPYRPTLKARERAATFQDLIMLLDPLSAKKRGKGQPRQMPPQLRKAGRDVTKWCDEEWAALIAHFWPRPSKARLKDLLEATGAAGNKGGWNRAVRIFELIAKAGGLHTAQPLRLLPPEKLSEFLRQVETVHLPAVEHGGAILTRMVGQLWSFGAAGVRPQEARKIIASDFSELKRLVLLLIRGTKSHRATRQPSVDNFAEGPGGLHISTRWMRSFESNAGKFGVDSEEKEPPMFASKGEAGTRYDGLNVAIRAGFADFIGEDFSDDGGDGTYTAYSLRHATVIRLIQGAIDSDYLYGNFQAALALVAKTVGHSYPVCLSHYLGTAALVLQWRSPRQRPSVDPCTSCNDFR